MLLLAAALASHQLGRGHASLDLAAALADAGEVLALPPDDGAEDAAPVDLLGAITLAQWQAAMRHPLLVGEGAGNTPLVLEGTRLYLRRYWQHERTVRESLQQRLQHPPMLDPAQEALLREALDTLFAGADRGAEPVDWQKVACALAARSLFSIVTGGPGTGKTTTVVKLLAVLQRLALADGKQLRIRLAAPTGKAAARLSGSIATAVAALRKTRDPVRHSRGGGNPGLPSPDLPTEVTTVHRLLGTLPNTRRFRHDARNPLPLDVLVLDEASMVDLEMMAAVLLALPSAAKVILLGDKDQLASVEAGAVLGELGARADEGHYLPATRDWLQRMTGDTLPEAMIDSDGRLLDQSIVKLRHSHRFDAASGIGRLAQAVNAGDMSVVHRIRVEGSPDLAFAAWHDDPAALRDLVLAPTQSYRHYLEVLNQHRPPGDSAPAQFDAWAREVLAAWSEFQLLCAVRRGPAGVEPLNARIAALLHAEGLTSAPQGWTLGRPVMVTRNDYGLGLMNGDVGVTLALPPSTGEITPEAWSLRVAFADNQCGIHWVLPSRLQSVETAYAMTVHKAQGSEFVHAALVLPSRMSRVLTRELLYTGITRARRKFTLVTTDAGTGVLEAAVQRKLGRTRGRLTG